LLEWHAGAVSETLLESELFGVARGTATDVRERPGIFESAGEGILCLSGIEGLDLGRQAALLRVLEGRTFQRLGASRPVRFEALLLAAFSLPPETLVARGKLRSDLLYRLDVLRITLPPLASRTEDIIPLARHFLRQACRTHKRPLPKMSPDLEKALCEAPWPGNLRELAQRMEASALTGGEILTAEDLPSQFWLGDDAVAEGLRRRMTLDELKAAYSRAVLARVGGNRTKAASWLGISRKALWAQLRRGAI
jgi:DNA-binding NtrC family response regulator